MSDVVIKVEQLSKQYRLGQVGTGSIADDLKRWWYNLRGKDDPFLKVGEENDRSQKGNSDYVWALRDINFSVKQGDVFGIIGKNGAGKSTLLKILSRTTSPTTGEYKIKGKVASLLEVGTGFHPELTGRENVFLNGALLGMTKSEIKKQFEEIVDFSGVERFIDTPVKRYSTGMYVRLAFAVASQLNPEILIIDEVLAVGDEEFQEKCLAKMKDVAGQGRTVLFVSHNMAMIKSLCTIGMLIDKSHIVYLGSTKEAIHHYSQTIFERTKDYKMGTIPADMPRMGTQECKFTYLQLINEKNIEVEYIHFKENIRVKFMITAQQNIPKALIHIKILSEEGIEIVLADNATEMEDILPGTSEYLINIPVHLSPGEYYFAPAIYWSGNAGVDVFERLSKFKVLNYSKDNGINYRYTNRHGYVQTETTWKKSKII